jgi:hypothetical protein
MKTQLQFADGQSYPVTDRTDLDKQPLSDLLQKFWKHRISPTCGCRGKIILNMEIVRKPTCAKAWRGSGSVLPSAGAAPAKVKVDEYYVRRDHETIDQHAPDCPFSLVRRDQSTLHRGERKVPLSAFGPLRDRSGSREHSNDNGGANAGQNLGTFNEFCNEAIDETCYIAARLAGETFGTPSTKVFFSCLGNEIRTFKGMTEDGMTPFDAANRKGCRLEFGLCRSDFIGGSFPESTGSLRVPLSTANMDGDLLDRTYIMKKTVFDRVTKHVRRRSYSLEAPYVWIGIISPDRRIERIWLWSVVVCRGKILLTDSRPENLFAANAVQKGNAVYKVRSVDDANLLIQSIIPDAPLLVTQCDFITWNGRILTIVEVVHCSANDKGYLKRLEKKERQKGGYLEIKAGGMLDYLRADMDSPETQSLFADPDQEFGGSYALAI